MTRLPILLIIALLQALAGAPALARGKERGPMPPEMEPAPGRRCQARPDPDCKELRRLRNLRLREAVQDGDLPPEQMHRPPPPYWRMSPDDAAPPPPDRVKPHFWRDRRKRGSD
ncbi:hypothetical protein HNO92_000723 [Chromobacterium alkanivorans]|uniref:hypothetical protein n=1 Tax=Chromobacterium TaxID=535 RepID=UPI00069F7CE3|nr:MULTISPECIES: hypothetical protein [Chromobacterium]MBN3004766.1 hypothetical protein [Chromobacterium alkanivorans]MCS3803063.1 hypothetical protein [Chromobacterium alkanivorans]MCS3817827.1 hypothetical protein [Chromobacterium alkanivorans]MCS3872429.1 hypothetical protein [Chromobacterium alkanivorans]